MGEGLVDARLAMNVIARIAGARAAAKELRRLKREEPHLARLVARHVDLTVAAVRGAGAPPCLPQHVEDDLDLLVARLVAAGREGRAQLWRATS